MREDLARQLQTRLEGLKAAGVEWVARPTPGTFHLPTPKPETPALDPNSSEGKRLSLQVVASEVAACTKCRELASTRTQTVFADGSPMAEIAFIGEAPGADEDRTGIPFVGAAGQMLNRIIAACGLKREEIFICNILRCRPPGNRTPKPDECANCRPYLERTLEIVQPKIICCWGGVAAQNLLQTTTGITRLRGQFYTYRNIPVLCTFHPSALLYEGGEAKKKDVWKDMKMLLAKIGRTVPEAKPKG